MEFSLDTNRSFLYGDGFFDTLLLVDGICQNYDLHYTRNIKSAKLLEIEWKSEWTIDFFKEILTNIFKQYNKNLLKVRFTFFRSSNGGYCPESNNMDFTIKTEIFVDSYPKIYNTGIFRKATKQINFFSGIKSTSSLLYVMAALEMKKQNWDEIIILNENGRVCESLNSNIYLKKNNIFYTPPLSEGCVDGTFRMQMLRGNFDFKTFEKPIELNELYEGRIYFSNAVKGLTEGKLI